jgi:WXG100 family type VII secretion target
MAETGGEIEITAERLHQCMDGIEQLVMSMSGDWQGLAGMTYAGKIVLLRQEYDKLESLLRDYARILRDAAEGYEDYDSVLAGKIDTI